MRRQICDRLFRKNTKMLKSTCLNCFQYDGLTRPLQTASGKTFPSTKYPLCRILHRGYYYAKLLIAHHKTVRRNLQQKDLFAGEAYTR